MSTKLIRYVASSRTTRCETDTAVSTSALCVVPLGFDSLLVFSLIYDSALKGALAVLAHFWLESLAAMLVPSDTALLAKIVSSS